MKIRLLLTRPCSAFKKKVVQQIHLQIAGRRYIAVPRQIVSCERGQFNSVENDPFCQGNSWSKYLSGP
jgi:hypothetical protein